jgi:hypothetical protein
LLLELPYREIWAVDFEFIADPGERPAPVCMVAMELRSRRVIRLWQDDLRSLKEAPFNTGPNSLFVAYYASAEIGCFLALGWSVPARVLDLFTEFRVETNGITGLRPSLLGALQYFGLPGIGAEEKASMRRLISNGGPWSNDVQLAILEYCQGDVEALEQLLPALAPAIATNKKRLGQALLRGRYMTAVARMEWTGVPIDVSTLALLRRHGEIIKLALIEEVDREFGVFEGLSFRSARFEEYLIRKGIPWPRLPSGRLALDRDTFRTQAKLYPELIGPIYELRQSLSELRLENLSVGSDGRCRTLLSPFRSKTGRNQPSTSKWIFGPSAWYRGLIKPPPWFSLVYLDWSSQEIAIAAALSGDRALIADYADGDPYLKFAKRTRLAPSEATKKSHKAVRDLVKIVFLAVNYGMSAQGLAMLASLSVPKAQQLLQLHRDRYPRFWWWMGDQVNLGLAGIPLQTRFGWKITYCNGTSEPNARSVMNFPMQAHGAEMLRLACCEATEQALSICAPVHDALLLETKTEYAARDIARLRGIMEKASEAVMGLPGFQCRVDVDPIHFPDRYMDPRGAVMWGRIMKLLDDAERRPSRGTA